MAKQTIRKTPPSISLYGDAKMVLQNKWTHLKGTYGLQEQIIDLIFRKTYAFQNTNADVVKLKTITLNLYYSTYIRATTKLATGILQIQNLDARLQNGDLTLVDDVANVLSRRNYSFATKYCACHNPKAYLMSIAMNLWRNQKSRYARRERIAPTISSEEEGVQLEDIRAEGDILDGIVKKEEITQLKKCVEKLSDKHRQVVLLFYAAQLPVEDIAKTLKIPKGTVKSRLNKARTMLKEEMEAQGYGIR